MISRSPAKRFRDRGNTLCVFTLSSAFCRALFICAKNAGERSDLQNNGKGGEKNGQTERHENLNFYKGKLLVGQNLRHNLAHKEKFYVSYNDYVLDMPENRIIKTTLEKLGSISTAENNSRQIRRLLLSFDSVRSSSNVDRDFSRVAMSRRAQSYRTLLTWSQAILKDKSFTTFSGDTTARAILFPMEKVFESYVARKMKQYIPEGWKLSAQDKGVHLFERPEMFSLRPDIVVTTDTGHTIILDTKWKRLVDNENTHYGISQGDMYQMFAYAVKYNTSDVWLLYPETEHLRGYKTDFISQYSEDLTIKNDVNVASNKEIADVRIFFVNIVEIEKSIQTLISMLKGQETVQP